MRDSVVFYKSFVDAIRNLPPEDFKEATLAILDYGLEDKIPEIDGITKVIFTLVRPQIDANNNRFKNGKKGGRPPKEDTEDEAEVEEKEQKHLYGENKKVKLTDNEYQKLCDGFGIRETEEAIAFLDDYIAEKGYKSKSHYLAMRRWVFEAVKDRNKKSAGKKGYNWEAL